VGQNNTEGIGLAEMRRQKLAALNWKDRHRLMLRPPGEADPWSAIPGPRPPPVAPPHVCRGRAP
jgi:hypothetical protein